MGCEISPGAYDVTPLVAGKDLSFGLKFENAFLAASRGCG
jgi:hypothetical protein